MIRKLGIEGIDGSGKTSVAQEVARQLGTEGLKAAIFSPYRMANALLGREMYQSWPLRHKAAENIAVLLHVLEQCDAAAAEQGIDVVIYDRHWMTAMTEIDDRPGLVAQWGERFIPTALLQVSPGTATRRIGNDHESQWSDLGAQARYADHYRELARKYPEHLLGIYRSEPDVSVETIAKTIIWDMNIQR
ncbi:MAG: hypothetical protein WBP12_04745 [Candidatus Saccharimonas sp.]